MKADRRHELQENDLVHAIEVVKTNVSNNARPIGIGVLVVVGVFVVTSLTVRSRSAAREDQWRRMSQLLFDNPQTTRESFETLASLAKNSSDPEFRMAAFMEQARQALILAQKPESSLDRDLMNRASEAFQQLLQGFSNNPLAVGFARCGLATVAENMYILTRQSKYKGEAEMHLKEVIKNPILTGLPFFRMANDRLAALDTTFRFVEFGPPTPEVGPSTPTVQRISPPPGINTNLPSFIQPPQMQLQTEPAAPPVQVDPSGPMNKPTDPEVDTAEIADDETEPPSTP